MIKRYMNRIIPISNSPIYNPSRNDYIIIEGNRDTRDKLFQILQKMSLFSFDYKIIAQRTENRTNILLSDKISHKQRLAPEKPLVCLAVTIATLALFTVFAANNFFDSPVLKYVFLSHIGVATMLPPGVVICYTQLKTRYTHLHMQTGRSWLQQVLADPSFFIATHIPPPLPKHCIKSPAYWKIWNESVRPCGQQIHKLFPFPNETLDIKDLVRSQLLRMQLFNRLSQDPQSAPYFKSHDKSEFIQQFHNEVLVINPSCQHNQQEYRLLGRIAWNYHHDQSLGEAHTECVGIQMAFVPLNQRGSVFNHYKRSPDPGQAPSHKLLPEQEAPLISICEIDFPKEMTNLRHITCQIYCGDKDTEAPLIQIIKKLFNSTLHAHKGILYILKPQNDGTLQTTHQELKKNLSPCISVTDLPSTDYNIPMHPLACIEVRNRFLQYCMRQNRRFPNAQLSQDLCSFVTQYFPMARTF